MLETLSLFLGIWLLFLLLAIYYLSQSSDGSLSRHFRDSVSEHLSADSRSKVLLREMLSENQYEQLIKFGYFEVSSPTFDISVYRITSSVSLVKVYELG